jgi:hypothetical protein
MPVYHVDVTQKDIDKGCKTNATHCPVARAGKRVFKCNVSVTSLTLSVFSPHGGWQDIPLPNEVGSFIRSFDRDKPVQPFSFNLDVTLGWEVKK